MVQPTTRFFSGKILMLTKLFLMSFVYEMIETFCFPIKKTKKSFFWRVQYKKECIFPYHVLTDTDNTCSFLMLVCKPEWDVPDEKFRDCIFEIIVYNAVIEMFDTSHEFWEKYSNRNQNWKRSSDILMLNILTTH